MFCTECGQQMADEAKFCAFCGTKRSVPAAGRETAAPPQPPAPEPPRAVPPATSPVRSTAEITPIRVQRPTAPPPAPTPAPTYPEPPHQTDSVVPWPSTEETTPPLFTSPPPVEARPVESYRPAPPAAYETARPPEAPAQQRYRSVPFAAEPGTPDAVEGRRKVSPVLIGAIIVAVIAIGGIFWMVRSSMSLGGKPSAPVVVTIYPASAKVAAGKSVDLKADVTGAPNSGVTWSIEEGDAGGAVKLQSSSTAEESSLYCTYTAPKTPGVYHLIATSTADKTKSATAEITVTAKEDAKGH